MINNVVLAGRITKEPELKKTGSDVSVCYFTIAVNRAFDKEKSDFINCVAWRQSAEYITSYVHKGDLLGVQGTLQQVTKEDGESYLNVNVNSVTTLSKNANTSQNEQKPTYNADYKQNQGNTYQTFKSASETKYDNVIDVEYDERIQIDSDELPFSYLM